MTETIPFLSQFGLAISLAYTFFLMYLLRQEEKETINIREFPSVSVLVAFRNESKNLSDCINCLINLDYPNNKIKILLLDDSSTDDSYEIAQKAIKNDNRFILLKVNQKKQNLQGKMNALATGIENTDSEFIFVTDADCEVDKNWIKTMLFHFTESTAMVSGFTVVKGKTNRFFDRLQTFDWAFLQGLAVYTSRSGRTITVLGNNLAFRRSVYKEIGGYESIDFSLTEDHALMRAIQLKTRHIIKYIFNPKAPVLSKAVENFSDFFQQRLRWSRGGLSGRFFAFGTVGMVFLAHLLILILFAAMSWDYAAGTAIGLIIGIDYLFSRRILREMKMENFKLLIIKYEIFLILYTSLLAFMTFLPIRVKWKGRTY